MSAKVIVVSSLTRGAGKTHFAAGLACWLKEHGHHSAPLQLSPAAGDPVACPEGGNLSRAGALLAEACGLMPEPVYESGWQALAALRQRFDTVVVEAPAGAETPGEWPVVHLGREGGLILPAGYAAMPEYQPDLMPGFGEAVEAIASLPPWSLASAPRCGVVTLPHIDNFTEYQMLRGSEWLTSPGVGRFANLFLPFTTNVASDLEWLEQTGLASWIAAQCAGGAKLSVCGWDYAGAERCELGDPLDFRYLSRQLGRRMAPLMPDEGTHQNLAHWFGEWASIGEFTRNYL
ncbi:MAG: hypothetical protein IPP47_31125 [Bryobacterales bacterium]|nr:hypothetical protein [Bryobacterales bacterium]